MRPQAIYIDWPFLQLQKLPSYTKHYAQALQTELEQEQPDDQKHHPEVLYIGGGGVNFVPERVGLDISGKLRELYSFNVLQEGTIEVAHMPFNAKHLDVWQHVGINRVVIKIDTIKQLKIPMDYLQTLTNTIVLDCTIVLTQETHEIWQRFFECSLATYAIKQISISLLKNSYRQLSDSFYHWLRAYLAKMGMQQYELYSFAYPGYESRYMQYVWDRKLIKGFGVGAESYDGIHRIKNTSSIKHYIRSIEQYHKPTSCVYSLTRKQIRLEQLLMGLRTINGISYQVLCQDLNEQQTIFLDEQIKLLESYNLIVQQGDRIILAPDGRGYEDTIILKLAI